MKNLKDLLKIALLSCFIFSVPTACVKDVDLDQLEELRIRPTAVVDIVDFRLEADLMSNQDPGIPIAVNKTVDFEVITDDLEEGVIGVEMGFDYSNSLPRTFSVSISFLSGKNKVQHSIQFDVPPGSKEHPVRDTFVYHFQGKELEALNRSTRVRVDLEMHPGPGATEGQLHLKSTAAYQFEF